MELIIKNKSQSFEQIVIDLNTYLRSLPDWESWEDYFKTGSGQTIIELIAGLGCQLFYFINILRQETYLQTAINRSSVIGIAQMLSYSTGRGNSVKARITVKADSAIVCNKFDIVGTCKNGDIIMADSVLLNEGEVVQLDIILGSLKRDYCKIETTALQPFNMSKPNVSEDYILYKALNIYTDAELEAIAENIDVDKTNWIQLPTSDKMLDMINDYYIVQTNTLSSVDIFYLNSGSGTHAYAYRQGEVLFLDYVELSDTEFELSDLDFIYGQVLSVDSVASYNPVETINSIKVNAPLANETQQLIRARNDGKKLVQQFGKNYISAVNTRDITSELIEVTYIKNDFTLLSEIEYEELYEYLYNKVRPFGIDMPYISPPIRAILNLDLDVELTNPLVRNTVTSSIESMVNNLEGQFILNVQGQQTQLDMYLIEQQIEDLYGVKIARIYIKNSEYIPGTYYRIGQFVTPNNSNPQGMFKLQKIVHTSGETEPTWPVHEGEYVEDGEIRWVTKPMIQGKGSSWQANTEYEISNIVYPSGDSHGIWMYEFDSYIGKSSDTEPEPPTDGIVIYDGQLIWYQISKNASAIEWTAETTYPIGEIINISTDEEHSYELIGFRGKDEETSINWPTPETISQDGNREIKIGNMIWKYYNNIDDRGNYKNPLLDYEWNQYLHIDYNLVITE